MDSIIYESALPNLEARWRRPIDPGGLGHLNNVLRDHLADLGEWIDHNNPFPADEDPLPVQELERRLRELVEVHSQLLEHIEYRAELAVESRAKAAAERLVAPAESAVRDVPAVVRSSIGTATETDKGSTCNSDVRDPTMRWPTH